MKRFDVIAFNYADTKYLIKRVIGLPGDKVEYKNNVLYVNDKKIEEDFLNGHRTNDFNTLSLGYEKIPEGKYLVLGDNRENSLDSRSFGLIDEKDILGKVTIKIWPFYEFDIVN
jgi:signal peptidase I